MSTYPCPKCRRPLEPTGEGEFFGHVFPIYQCDECLVQVPFDGEMFDTALTFCVGADGRLFSPSAPNEPFPS